MDVFISWSGERSRLMASALRDWLPKVIQSLKPFMSETDIAAGTDWAHEIHDRLTSAAYGIICVTAENWKEPWLNYEAGALANSVTKPRVCPVFLEIRPTDISGPLARFQSKVFQKTPMFEVVLSLNESLSAEAVLDKRVVGASFDAFWPELEEAVKKIPKSEVRKPERDTNEMLAETLDLVRDLSRKPSYTFDSSIATKYTYIPTTVDYTSTAMLSGTPITFEPFPVGTEVTVKGERGRVESNRLTSIAGSASHYLVQMEDGSTEILPSIMLTKVSQGKAAVRVTTASAKADKGK